MTGVYFEDFDGSNLDIPSQNRLQMSGLGLTPDQRETALAIFRTIRSLASESQGRPEPNQRDDAGICCKPLVEGEPDPNQYDGPVNDPAVAREPGSGIAVGEPYPMPPIEPTRTITIIDDIDPNACNWIHNINACFSDGQAPADIPMDEFMGVLWLAREDLSQRITVEIGSIKLAEIERAGWPVYWPEEPQPGVAYIDIALAGFRMVLEADGQAYWYETDASETVVFVG